MKKLVLSLCIGFVLMLPVQKVDAQVRKTISNSTFDSVSTQANQNRLQEMTTILQKDNWTQIFGDEFNNPNHILNVNWAGNLTGIWWTDWGWGQVHDPDHDINYCLRYIKETSPFCPDQGGLNHILDGQTLKLSFREEPGNYEIWYWDPDWKRDCKFYKYTAATIRTLRKFLYGYFEIRCKIPNQGLVLWPAFWMWGADENGYREIDIAEFNDCSIYPGHCRPNVVGMNLHIQEDVLRPDCHWTDASGNPIFPYINCYYGEYIVTGHPDITEGFHTYAVRWMPNSVTWFVDGQPVHMLAEGHVPAAKMELTAGNGVVWWCPPDYDCPNSNPCGIVLNNFPYDFDIDYIRVSKSLNKEFLWEWGNEGMGGICFDCGGPYL